MGPGPSRPSGPTLDGVLCQPLCQAAYRSTTSRPRDCPLPSILVHQALTASRLEPVAEDVGLVGIRERADVCTVVGAPIAQLDTANQRGASPEHGRVFKLQDLERRLGLSLALVRHELHHIGTASARCRSSGRTRRRDRSRMCGSAPRGVRGFRGGEARRDRSAASLGPT